MAAVTRGRSVVVGGWAAMVWLLAGCQSGDPGSGCSIGQDPAEGGFLAGATGLLSGAYEDREACRQADMAAEQARGRQLDEAAATQSDLERLRMRLAELRDRLAALRDRQPGGPDDEARLGSEALLAEADAALAQPPPSTIGPDSRQAAIEQILGLIGEVEGFILAISEDPPADAPDTGSAPPET
jgi:hypothetical protein